MPRDFTPKVVTANALIEGDVVYLTVDDQWTRHLSEAEVLTDEADADYRLLQAQARAGEIVGAYLADMRPGPSGPSPPISAKISGAPGPRTFSTVNRPTA